MLTSKASCLAAVLGAGAGEAAGLRARPSSSGPSLGCRSEEKQCGEMEKQAPEKCSGLATTLHRCFLTPTSATGKVTGRVEEKEIPTEILSV